MSSGAMSFDDSRTNSDDRDDDGDDDDLINMWPQELPLDR